MPHRPLATVLPLCVSRRPPNETSLMRSLSTNAILLVPLWLVQATVAVPAAETRVHCDGPRWILENDLLKVSVEPAAGRLCVLDKRIDQTWQQAPDAKDARKYRDAREIMRPSPGIAMVADVRTKSGKDAPLTVTLTLAADVAELAATAEMPPETEMAGGVAFLEPLILDASQGVLAIADYGNGHIYPLDESPFPRRSMSTSRMDMPWLGMCDLAKGVGYLLLIETSDDGLMEMRPWKQGDRTLVAPRIVWNPSRQKFSYPRRVLYHFVAEGGYVALAKRYRDYARAQGLVVPLAEKLKKNPNLRRLFGAPDVWGDASLKFAQEAKLAGVEKMLIHGRRKPEEMKAINELGYLTSEYDNYTDVLPLDPGKEIDKNHDHIPQSVVLKADGQRMTAWLTFDKKQQYMKRCPALWLRTAQATVPKLLVEYPFLGRFIDVTTAEDLYECHDPNHPLTRTQKRECGAKLLGYVRGLNLVMGGEHGIWWGVPHLDYIEGMMSGGYASWPAGHLKHPKTKDEEFTSPQGRKLGDWETYARWGIGHENRVPLWDLVFHDCIVSTWYWGDASDWLLDAAPEITPKKDALNVLYGTIPLLWANKEGSWQKDRNVFLRTYRNTCKMHEVVAGTELLSHEFVTPDRAVHRTRFSDGTQTIVNFGPKPYPAELDGQKFLLPENGWAVKGPQFEQSRALVNGRVVTIVRSGSFQHREEETAQEGLR